MTLLEAKSDIRKDIEFLREQLKHLGGRAYNKEGKMEASMLVSTQIVTMEKILEKLDKIK